MTMLCDDAGTKPVRRLEVFTGAGRRREWSDEAKATIVAESYTGLESVSAVARRYALVPSQLFTWRRDFRCATDGADLAASMRSASEPFFVPAVIEPQRTIIASGPAPVSRKRRARRAREAAVELEINAWR